MERLWGKDLVRDTSFGEKHVVLSLYERLAHDEETEARNSASGMEQMRIMVASDDNLIDLAKYLFPLLGGEHYSTWQEILEMLTERRKLLRAEESGFAHEYHA